MVETGLPRVHVAFCASAAGSLKAALEMLGRNEELLYLTDELSIGPIATGDALERVQWAIDEIGFEEGTGLEKHIAAFWERVTTVRAEIVAWMSRRSVTEYCGLLALLWRVRDAPVSIIDVADVEFSRRDGSPSPSTSSAFSVVAHQQIVAKGLYDRAVRVSDLERKRYEREWERLRQENAVLRVLTASGVISVPITYFDATILSHVTDDWQTFARVIGDTIGKMSELPYWQVRSDHLFFDRLLRLVDDGVIEGKKDGELWSFRGSWVRCPPVPNVASPMNKQ